jgi:hypothetical protein
MTGGKVGEGDSVCPINSVQLFRISMLNWNLCGKRPIKLPLATGALI